MANATVVLNTRDLVRFYPSFATIEPGWSQQVTLVYTPDKNDKVWDGDSEDTGGTLVSSERAEKTRSLKAVIAINVAMIKSPKTGSMLARPGSKNGEFVASKPTLNEMRQSGVRLLSHELLHVIQEWVRPGGYASHQEDATRKVLAQHPCLLFHPEDRARQAYQENEYEKAAYRSSEEFVSKNRADINAGDFDDYLPIPMMVPPTK